MIRSLRQRGDTIVEVLFAIAILSLVITGAYNFATRNLLAGRQAQERTEATQLAQSQIESLAAAATQSSSPIFSESKIFCFENGTVHESDAMGGTVPVLSGDDFGNYDASCKVNADGTPGGFYNLAIKNETNGEFSVYVRWYRIGGRSDTSRDEVGMVYRVHQL